MTAEQLAEILRLHALWLATDPAGGRASLDGANLTGANLTGANLTRANLDGANLTRANLDGAYLTGAYLPGANLDGANLTRAYLTRAYLTGANLTGANLDGANLDGANLTGANLTGAKLPHYQIPQKGALIVYKKLSGETVARLQVPAKARRTASLVGRKCRAEYVKVLEGEGYSRHDRRTHYSPGKTVRPDSYDDDPRIECAPGIHFFLTRQEAEEYV